MKLGHIAPRLVANPICIGPDMSVWDDRRGLRAHGRSCSLSVGKGGIGSSDGRITQDEYDKKARELKEGQAEIATCMA